MARENCLAANLAGYVVTAAIALIGLVAWIFLRADRRENGYEDRSSPLGVGLRHTASKGLPREEAGPFQKDGPLLGGGLARKNLPSSSPAQASGFFGSA